MHGQAKVKTTDEEKEKKRKEREQKVQVYKSGMAKIFEKRRNGEHDDEGLTLIADMLYSNPDIYTLWNYRKEILETYKKQKSNEDLEEVLQNEMRLTEMCLKRNPKSYCSWYHRLWLINNWPRPDLPAELNLCNKYLKFDERNFHCWDYRRAVVTLLGLKPDEELQYTLTKIEENFSNYSSWHYRSKLLPLIHPDPAGIRPIDEKNHLFELELVENAAFTDPNDQSAWFYLRWLLGRLKPSLEIVVATAGNGGQLCVAFNQDVTIRNSDNGDVNNKHDTVNITIHTYFKNCCEEIKTLKWIPLQYSHDAGIMSSKAWTTDLPATLSDIVTVSIAYPNGHENKYYLNVESNYSYSIPQAVFDFPFSPNLVTVLKQQLNSSNDLLELEPDSKWTLLTSVVLMQALDKHKYMDLILKRIELLKECDKLRTNYYDDLRSRFLIECKLEDWDFQKIISLKNLNLTSLYHSQYLIDAITVDLTDNRLYNSLHNLCMLTKCETLILDNNRLENLQGLPIKLPCLKSLSLHGNQLSSVDDIVPYLSMYKTLERLVISNNPIATHGFGDLAMALPGVSIICDSHSAQV